MRTSIIFLIFFLAVAFKSESQLSKGIWLVGGNGSYEKYHQGYNLPGLNVQNKGLVLKISPEIGLFIKSKCMVGLKNTFEWDKDRSNGGGYQNTKYLFTGPFIRYYLLKEDNFLNIITEVNYQIGTMWSQARRGPINNFSFLAGPTIFLNSSVGLELLLGYSLHKEGYKNVYTLSTKSIITTIGFHYYLEK